MLRRPAHVVANEKIKEAVAVIIEPERGGAESLTHAQATGARYIEKSSLARVAKQPVLPHASDQDIGKAVIVIVTDCDAHSVHLDIEARGFCHVSERAVAIVFVEPRRGAETFVAGPIHSIDQQDILPAIRVIIEEDAARAERFRK